MNESIHEKYEDALFAMIMQSASNIRGKTVYEQVKFLNKADDIHISSEFDRKIGQLISQKTKVAYIRINKRSVRKTVKHIAIAVCIFILLVGTALAVSPTLRNEFWKVFSEIKEDGTYFYMSYTGEERVPDSLTGSVVEDYEIGWIPEGFVFLYEEISPMDIVYYFENDDEDSIRITKMSPDAACVIVDTEDAKVTNITYGNQNMLISEKENIINVSWISDNDHSYYSIVADNTSRKTAMKIAKNILAQ